MRAQPSFVVPAGWYVDPQHGRQLRWWSGVSWTEHLAPLPELIDAPTGTPGPASTETAAPEASATASSASPESVGSAEFAVSVESPASATPLSRRELRERAAASAMALTPPAPRIAPVSNYDWTDETEAADTFRSAGAPAPLDNIRQIPSRWNTVSAWLLAFTPWLLVCWQVMLSILFVVNGNVWIQVGALALPLLLTLAWAQRDGKRLRSWGHDAVPHWAWAFLGPLGYLIARTVVLRRNAGVGAAPLWAWIINLIVVVGGSALLTFAALTAYVPEMMLGIEQSISADLQSSRASYTVDCPDTLTSFSLTFTCTATDATGTTQPIDVQLDGFDGAYYYSVPQVLPAQAEAGPGR